MPVFGNMIKGLIDFKDFITREVNPIEAQKAVLKVMLNQAKNT